MELWPKISVETGKEYNMCFGCGKMNPIGLQLEFKWNGKTASTQFTPGENHQGWGGYVHGGITSCVLDEAMGRTAMYAGFNNVTALMQIRYRKMIRILETYEVTCTVTRQTSRLIETEAKILDGEGQVMAEATSTQFVISPAEEEIKRNE